MCFSPSTCLHKPQTPILWVTVLAMHTVIQCVWFLWLPVYHSWLEIGNSSHSAVSLSVCRDPAQSSGKPLILTFFTRANSWLCNSKTAVLRKTKTQHTHAHLKNTKQTTKQIMNTTNTQTNKTKDPHQNHTTVSSHISARFGRRKTNKQTNHHKPPSSFLSSGRSEVLREKVYICAWNWTHSQPSPLFACRVTPFVLSYATDTCPMPSISCPSF